MSFLPMSMMFTFILIFSIFFSISSSHWFGVWLGLELNMVAFIVLVMKSGSLDSNEGSIKYFLLQALGSGVFLLGSMCFYMDYGVWFISVMSSSLSMSEVMILLGLLTKLGAAPLHFWVPGVMNSLSWSNSFILSSVQKIIPLFIIISLWSMNLELMVFLAVSGTLIGGAGGMNQSQLRALLGYSSIGHLGWILGVSVISFYFSFYYFSVYLIIIGIVFWLLSVNQFNQVKLFSMEMKGDIKLRVILGFCLLSLGGLPPLLGFFPKMMAFKLLSMEKFILMLLLMILGSLMSLFYYLSLFFNDFLVSTYNFKHKAYFINVEKSLLVSLMSVVAVTMLVGGFMMMELFSIF